MGRWVDEARKIKALMEFAGAKLIDEDAAKLMERGGKAFWPEWDASAAYAVGDRAVYGGLLWRCLQAHVAQATWTPTDAPSLWTRVLTSDSGEPLPWMQPESTNPYMKGDKVTHAGKTWVSTIDNNVWEPGVYGWEETGG